MRVIIGGAYNGKRRFVRNELGKDSIKKRHFYEGVLPEQITFGENDHVIVGSFEKLIMSFIHLDEEAIASKIFDALAEIDETTEITCICTDIGRGVVPIHQGERKLRDACGRLYQRLFQYSDEVIRVWYGIPEILKSKGL